MIFKLSNIKRVDIFSPGTAGEKAIRIETLDGQIEIFDSTNEKFIAIIEYETTTNHNVNSLGELPT